MSFFQVPARDAGYRFIPNESGNYVDLKGQEDEFARYVLDSGMGFRELQDCEMSELAYRRMMRQRIENEIYNDEGFTGILDEKLDNLRRRYDDLEYYVSGLDALEKKKKELQGKAMNLRIRMESNRKSQEEIQNEIKENNEQIFRVNQELSSMADYKEQFRAVSQELEKYTKMRQDMMMNAY